MAMNAKGTGKWGTKGAVGFGRWVSVAFLGLLMAGSTFAQNPVLLYSATAGAASQISVVTTTPVASPCCRAAYVAGVYINGDAHLEVNAWNDTGSSLVRIGSATWDPPKAMFSLAATALDSHRIVTADADTAGNLSVNVWGIGIAGQAPVYRQGGDSIPSCLRSNFSPAVGITALSSTQVVTVDLNLCGYGRVQVWDISSGGVPTPQGSLSEYDFGITGKIVAINSSQVVTTYVKGGAQFQIGVWGISNGGATVTLQASAPIIFDDTYASGLALAPLGGFLGGPYEVMVPSWNGSTLTMTDWLIPSSGPITITEGDTGSYQQTSGSGLSPAVAWAPNYFPFTINSAAETGNTVALWGLDNNSWLELGGDSPSGIHYGSVAAEGFSSSAGLGYYVTAGLNTNQDFVVAVWSTPIN